MTYVGDAPWDVAAARAAGFRFIGIAGGSGERRALESAGAKVILSDFNAPSAFTTLTGALL